MERDVPNFNFMDIKQQFVFLMINEDIKYYIFYKRYIIWKLSNARKDVESPIVLRCILFALI
jgi:hypothetical protein